MYKLILENKVGNQLTFNEIGGAFTITEIEGLNPPSATINTSEVALMDGQLFDSAKLDMRQLNIAFAIERDAAANRIEVYKVLKSKQWIKTYYKSQYRNVSIEGYISEINIGYFDMKQVVTVSILCPSPYWQDAQQMVNELSQIIDSFHFSFYGISAATPQSINLERFYSVSLEDPDYWYRGTWSQRPTYTELGDGWLNVAYSGRGIIYLPVPLYNEFLKKDTTYTVMAEFANVSSTNGFRFGGYDAAAAQLRRLSGQTALDTVSGDCVIRKSVSWNIPQGIGIMQLLALYFELSTTDDISFDIRVSLYEGDYTGDYVAFEGSKKNVLFGYIDPTANVEVVNLGDVETGMIIELYARETISNPKIIDYISGDFIGLNYTMQAADLITIDTRAGHKTVTLMRNAQTSNIFNSLMDGITWLQLPIGGGVYAYEVGSGDAVNLQTSISFTNLYEGV